MQELEETFRQQRIGFVFVRSQDQREVRAVLFAFYLKNVLMYQSDKDEVPFPALIPEIFKTETALKVIVHGTVHNDDF